MIGAEVAVKLRRILEQVDGLPDHDLRSITVLVSAGEWAVALETICTQIHEYDADISIGVRNDLLQLGRQLGVAAGFLLGDPWEEPGNRDGRCADDVSS